MPPVSRVKASHTQFSSAIAKGEIQDTSPMNALKAHGSENTNNGDRDVEAFISVAYAVMYCVYDVHTYNTYVHTTYIYMYSLQGINRLQRRLDPGSPPMAALNRRQRPVQVVGQVPRQMYPCEDSRDGGKAYWGCVGGVWRSASAVRQPFTAPLETGLHKTS